MYLVLFISATEEAMVSIVHCHILQWSRRCTSVAELQFQLALQQYRTMCPQNWQRQLGMVSSANNDARLQLKAKLKLQSR